MEIKVVELKDLKPYYNNPRDNAGAVPAVIESFKRYGFIKPIICDKDGVIIAGHTRYIAAFQLELKTVPVVFSEMDDEHAKLFRIADNKLAEKSEFDENLLLEELKKLEVPSNLQAFFFEDINEMVNFSYGDLQSSYGEYDYTESESDYTSEYSDSSDIESGDNGIVEENTDVSEQNKEEDVATSEYDDLYKLRIVDGKKMMKVVCPYCGNIETIEIE
jgi:hypothetical protein